MVLFHTVGDSHCTADQSVWTFPVDEPHALQTHHLGPVLMHSFGRDGGLKTSLLEYGVTAGDWVCFCFGEIDCRCHVNKHVSSSQTFEQVIDKLVSSYMAGIATTSAAVPGVNVAVFMVVPPCRSHVAFNPEYPYVGTDEQRRAYTLYMNIALKRACTRFSYTFIDAYDAYVDSEGFLDAYKSDGKNHARFHVPIQVIVSNLLGKNGVGGGSEARRKSGHAYIVWVVLMIILFAVLTSGLGVLFFTWHRRRAKPDK